jgi:peptide/nickel transport system permease protein
MTTAATDKMIADDGCAGRSLWSDAARKLRHDKAAMACLAVICLYAAVAVISPWVLSGWAGSFNYDNINQPPSANYILGTDGFGRSVMEETLLAANTSMTVALMSNVIAVPLGMLLGAIAGYYGGWVDDVIVWLFTTLASIPGIIRLIAIKFAFTGKVLFAGTWFAVNLDGMAGLYVALGVMSWIGTCRLVRAETMKIRQLDYCLAARSIGTGKFATLLRHVMPNVAHIGIINFSLGFQGAITAEVILSYLGLGVKDAPSWGRMVDAGKMDLVVGRWWELAAAVGATFIIVLVWNIFGDRLRDALDPKLRNA